MICYIAPPITVVFIWGVFWKQASNFAAKAALYIGSALGLVVFIIDWFKNNEKMLNWLHDNLSALSPLWDAWAGYNIPFMLMAFYLFCACSAILVVCSLIKPHQHTEESISLVWKNPLEPLKSPGWPGIGNYKFLAILLFVVMIVLYTVFR